jgi:hypothetical protein
MEAILFFPDLLKHCHIFRKTSRRVVSFKVTSEMKSDNFHTRGRFSF